MSLRLLLLAALAASGPALAEAPSQGAARNSPERPGAADQAEDDFSKPPPGSPADQELWQAGRQASTNIRVSRAEASKLARFARHNRLDERLKAAAKASPSEAASLGEVRDRLMSRWKENYGILSRRWPVDVVRGCHSQLLLFESALHAKAAKGPRPGVELAREDVKTCVAKAGAAVKQMTDANVALSGAIDEAVKRLADVEPARPQAGASSVRPVRAVPPAAEAPKG